MTQPLTNESVPHTSFWDLLTKERWMEIGRIMAVSLVIFLFWMELVPVAVLWFAVVVGLYPLVVTGVRDLVQERKLGTEIFVTLATIIAVTGGETLAGAVLMTIILIAEFIADLNTDRARASIKGLIGTVPQTAIVKDGSQQRIVQISALGGG